MYRQVASSAGWTWPTGTLLSRLDPSMCDAMLALGVERSVEAGSVLLRQGDRGAHIVLLRCGSAKVTFRMIDGREALLAIRVAGDIVGEMSALNDQPRSASVVTCGRSVVNVIQRQAFQVFLTTYPRAAIQVAGMVADRLRWANELRIEFVSYPAHVRLARVLTKIAQTYGRRTPEGVVVDVQLTQPELASLCGAAEVTVQKALRVLRKEGLVATGYRRVVVVDLEALGAAGELNRG